MNPKNCPIFILAGGLGTRISEETALKPKPMVEVGGLPIILHIMRSYYAFGFNDFVICAGYRSWEIKEYFLNYKFRLHHLQIDMHVDGTGTPTIIGNHTDHEKWRVRIIETGLESMTGSRIACAFDEALRQTPFENFGVTYGDGVCDVNLLDEFNFHIAHGKVGTVLGVHPLSRFGELNIRGETVIDFAEKPDDKVGLINGGFFFFKKTFRDYLDRDQSLILERQPLARLAKDRELQVYKHLGFWQAMDTLRDKNYLQGIWDSKKATWSPESLKKKFNLV